jgi:decaprenyl-phosphate phosphoribosyltransferase
MFWRCSIIQKRSLSINPVMKPTLISLLTLMRPHQWLKNVFVFAGLMFSQSWGNGPVLHRILIAFAAFCCASSLVYILNDWHDRASDALHPIKSKRPLASGALKPQSALVLAALLLLTGLWLAYPNPVLLLLLGLYVLLNLAYSWRLKHVPVVDVSIIASGFMLRLLAGTLAVGIPPSRWLLLTGLFVALFLGFSKRKAESFHDVANQRSVMAHYPSVLLDTYMAATMTATITTYSLYATSFEATVQHGERLVYTVPVVIFALLRYTYQVHQGRGEDVSRDMLRDPWIILAMAAWLLIFLGHRF